jgi:Flp pilus assembly protein TadG
VKNSSSNAKSERGSELVEFALTLTILLSLIFGIIGFAQAAYAYHFVSNVAREATRYASVRGLTCPPAVLSDCPMTDLGIESYVKNLAPSGINASQLSATRTSINPGGNCNGVAYNPGCAVQVNVTYPFAFLPMLHLPSFTISSTSQMVISQ